MCALSSATVPTNAEDNRQSILIVGASARAAAFSAIRAGMRPVAADLYGDSDLRAVAEYVPVSDYSRGLPAAVDQLPDIPWIYTGALENSPELIGQLASRRPLWGNPPETLRAVRDPLQITSVLHSAGLPALAVRAADRPPPPDGSWLIKPRRGGGGRGINFWNAACSQTPTLREPHFFQRFVHGAAISAIFLGTNCGIRPLGTTRQFLNGHAVAAPGRTRQPQTNDIAAVPAWMYVGGIAPLELSAEVQQMVDAIGRTVGEGFRLRGLFGCDFCLEAGTPWLTEINPRYTAAVELLERDCSRALLHDHRRVFQPAGTDCPAPVTPVESSDGPRSESIRKYAAKRILFATSPLTIPRVNSLEEWLPQDGWPTVADLPAAGTSIESGHPICTVFASGRTAEDCHRQLADRAAEVWHRLTGARRQFAIES